MERKRENNFCNTALGNGTGTVAFCKTRFSSAGQGCQKVYFPSHLGRMRLQSEVHLLSPLPSKHQLSGQWIRHVTELRADFVTFCEALALAVFWFLHPEGFKFSVPLRSRRQRTCASRLLPEEQVERGGGGDDNPSQLLQYWITVCH